MNTIILDCSHIIDAAQLHNELAQKLSFPEWYGHNLDALFDCLTDLTEETLLVLLHWDQTAAYCRGFESAFADAAMENPLFTYTIL